MSRFPSRTPYRSDGADGLARSSMRYGLGGCRAGSAAGTRTNIDAGSTSDSGSQISQTSATAGASSSGTTAASVGVGDTCRDPCMAGHGRIWSTRYAAISRLKKRTVVRCRPSRSSNTFATSMTQQSTWDRFRLPCSCRVRSSSALASSGNYHRTNRRLGRRVTFRRIRHFEGDDSPADRQQVAGGAGVSEVGVRDRFRVYLLAPNLGGDRYVGGQVVPASDLPPSSGGAVA